MANLIILSINGKVELDTPKCKQNDQNENM